MISYPAYDAFGKDIRVGFARWCVYMRLRPGLRLSMYKPVRFTALGEMAQLRPAQAFRAMQWLVTNGYVLYNGAGYKIAWATPEQIAAGLGEPELEIAPESMPSPTPAYVRASGQKRRARKAGVIGQHTAADIHAKLEAQEGRCFYCDQSIDPHYHVEHMVPLSRGGSNAAENICLACPTCNMRKGRKTASEFMAGLLAKRLPS